MLWLKSCPRCGGDLFPEYEEEDSLWCLLCGNVVPETEIVASKMRRSWATVGRMSPTRKLGAEDKSEFDYLELLAG